MTSSKDKILEGNPRLEISVSTVTKLIEDQFPEWAPLSIRPVARSGWDNRTFHLGDEMSVRLPSSKSYIHQVAKEQKWLPHLASQLSLPISQPLAMGRPSDLYPWHWSVYRWIAGENADNLKENEYEAFAFDIAQFLKSLHQVETEGGPKPGPFYRGASPKFYDSDTKGYLSCLQDVIDVDSAREVWEVAISSTWEKAPVWVHGDFATGNILVKDGKLNAVIDFGSCCVGDPACDLVIAWTFLKGRSREIFKENLLMDDDTWARARGWAIWKAMFNIATSSDKTSLEVSRQKQIIQEVIDDHH